MSSNHQEAEKKDGALTFLLPLLLLAFLSAGVYYLFGTGTSHQHNEEHTAIAETKKAAPVEEKEYIVTKTRETYKVKLVNGLEINAYKGGIEDKLVAFLNSDYNKLSTDSLKKIWFDFDNLNFNTNSAELKPESQNQVDNMTAILKAYPEVKLKIGGYTDKTGDETKNMKLSADRAAAVKTALAKAGVGAQITDAEGYGSEWAKYAADAPESDKVKDRRVSVSVRL